MGKHDPRRFGGLLYFRQPATAIMLMFCLAMFTSCFLVRSPAENTVDSLTGQTEKLSDESEGLLVLAEDAKALVKIVRPDMGTDAEITAAKTIAAAIERMTGELPVITSDFLMPGKEHEKDTVEILIGSTNYTETEQATRNLCYGTYSIYITGNKIVLAAAGDNAINSAAEALVASFKSDQDNKTVTVTRDLILKRTVVAAAAELPIFSGGTYNNMYDSGDGTYLILYRNAEKSEYDTYLAALDAAGYGKTASNTVNQNESAFYLKGGSAVSVNYIPSAKEVRISVGPDVQVQNDGNLSSKRICTTQLTLVGLAFDTKGNGELYPNGLSLVMRISDGRFIIIDGGGKNDTHAKRLYDILSSQAPDPGNIVIAAWILTHAHIDHVGTFHQFASGYTDKVTVQNIIMNFPTVDFYNNLAEGGDGTGMSDEIRADVKKFKDAKVLKAHMGQKFVFGDAEISILYSIDENYPRSSSSDSNSTSLVFTLTVGEEKILVTGDASSDVSGMLCRYYANSLKSDIVTVNHHGYGGATVQLYSLIDPEIVLWPASDGVYSETKNRDYNKHLLNNLHVKEVHVSGSVTYTITLAG